MGTTADDPGKAPGRDVPAESVTPDLELTLPSRPENVAVVRHALGGFGDDITAVLTRVQNELFDVGADLCNPVSDNPPYPPLRIDGSYVSALEHDCDEQNADLPTLRSFILPGGAPGAALLHTARTVVRRAERSAWAALAAHGDTMNPLTAHYLNRLSDLLFILSRGANRGEETLWEPGRGQ